MRVFTTAVAFVGLAALTVTATRAQGTDAGGAAADAPRPAFAMLDNTGDGAEVVAELGAIISTDDASDVILHPRLLGQYFAASGVGGYAAISATDNLGTGSAGFSLGNLELGGLYHTALTPELDIGMRVGLVLDTGTGSASDAFARALTTGLLRPGDLAAGLPATSLRFGLSPTLHTGMFFARIDAGIDRTVAHEGTGDNVTLGHLNLGAGIGRRAWSVTAELGLAFAVGESSTDSVKVVGLAAHYQVPGLAPYLLVSRPFDLDGDVSLIQITAGAAFAI